MSWTKQNGKFVWDGLTRNGDDNAQLFYEAFQLAAQDESGTKNIKELASKYLEKQIAEE